MEGLEGSCSGVCDECPRVMSLPVEILELIMSMLSFHRDLPNVRLVCQLWNSVAKRVMERCRGKFLNSLEKGQLVWSHLGRSVSFSGSTISSRFLHSACYYDRAMYVFGGCTSRTTCFNDIWKFDLGTNKWSRKYANGSYPAPKAWASLVPHEGQLILFGGCTQSIGLIQEQSRVYNQIHFLDLESDQWVLQNSINPPDGRSGHQASIIKNKMIITCGNDSQRRKCNDAWLLDLSTFEWTEITVHGPKPQKRRGHSQAILDDQHVVLMSGFGDRREPISDVWLLTILEDSEGSWRELKVHGLPNSPSRTYGHMACQVGQKMVMLGKLIRSCSQSIKKRQCPNCLHQNRSSEPLKHSITDYGREIAQLSSPQSSFRPNSRNDRNRRYEMLSFYEKRLKRLVENVPGDLSGRQLGSSNSPECNCLTVNNNDKIGSHRNIHLLDMSTALTDYSVKWLTVNKSTHADSGDHLFYSLVNCVNEIVKFGGFEAVTTDESVLQNSQPTTNEISFLSHKDHLFSN